MRFLRRLHRPVCALLGAALLVVALLPAMVAATGASGTWAEICTTQGSRWVLTSPGDDEPRGPSNLSHAATDHCPVCSSFAHGAAPPPAPSPLVADPVARDAWPGRFYQAAATPHPWRAAQPRAPPRIS